jgi:hypothetical protein
MNKVIFQFWENSILNLDVMSDGCSLHIDVDERDRWIKNMYYERKSDQIPDEYDRVVGDSLVCFVEDDLYQKIKTFKTIRISENQLNNLIDMNEILIKDI